MYIAEMKADYVEYYLGLIPECSKETRARTFWLQRFKSQREYSTEYSTEYSEILGHSLLRSLLR